MRGIYKRGNIYWIRYAGLDGKMRFESTHSTRYKDAEALLLKRKQEIKEGKNPDLVKKIPNCSFRELAEQYVVWAENQRSFRSKKYIIQELVSRFGNLQLRQFSTLMLEQYQMEKLKEGKKPATINRTLACIKHMFTKAIDWDLVESEVLKKIRKVKFLQENNRRLRYLSVEECKKLIEACDRHLRPIVITALNTGMRKGEILSLKWENVDLRHGFILLQKTKNGERREIPINDTLRAVFQSIPRRLDVPYVFYDEVTGKPYKDVKRSFKTACRKAGIYDFKFHDLRHTFASHLVMAGVDLTTVKELLGHKDLKMTLRYSHLAPAHKKNAVQVISQILSGESTIQKLYNFGS